MSGELGKVALVVSIIISYFGVAFIIFAICLGTKESLRDVFRANLT